MHLFYECNLTSITTIISLLLSHKSSVILRFRTYARVLIRTTAYASERELYTECVDTNEGIYMNKYNRINYIYIKSLKQNYTWKIKWNLFKRIIMTFKWKIYQKDYILKMKWKRRNYWNIFLMNSQVSARWKTCTKGIIPKIFWIAKLPVAIYECYTVLRQKIPFIWHVSDIYTDDYSGQSKTGISY